MKRHLPLLFVLLVLGSLILSGCAGGAIGASSWPGLASDGNNVYLASATRIFAVNGNDGSLKWSYPDINSKNKLQFFAEPVLNGDTVIVGDFGHTLYGLAKEAGLLQWQFTQARQRWVASSLVVGDVIIAPNTDRSVYGLDAKGNLKWTFATRESIWSQPASDGKTVFQPSMDHFVYALDVTNGNKVWATDCGGAILSNAYYHEAQKAVIVGTMAGELIALSATDGTPVWRTKLGSSIWARPVLHENAFYVGDYNGNAHKVDAKTGEIVWKKELGSTITGPALSTPEGVVFNTNGGALVMFSPDGEQKWRIETKTGMNSNPVLAADKIIVPLTKADVLLDAYDLKGSKQWSFSLPK